jgi:RimJ/RimL family protein N-acetyltransferase
MAALLFPDPPLRVAGIRLRPWCEADVPAIVAMCSDPLVAAFIPTIPVPYTEDDARSWLGHQEPTRLAGQILELAIVAVATDAVLGSISASINHDARSASVGYFLAPEARGKGYATMAMRRWCVWLFETLALGRISLTTDTENLASQRVAKRCGFQPEGLLRSHMYFPSTDQRRDAMLWGLLPGELVEEQDESTETRRTQ